MSRAVQAARALTTGGTGITVAVMVMNVGSYLFTMIAARFLGPRNYGAFAAVMGLLLVLGVLQLGLQTTGARRIAANPEQAAGVERALLRAAHRFAVGLSLVCLAATPLIARTLRLHDITATLLVALTAWPMTILGGQIGVLQGERRWRALAVVYVVAGLSRLLIGTALLWWRPGEAMAVAAVAISFALPVIVGRFALQRSVQRQSVPGRKTSDDGDATQALSVEILHNSHVLAAFLALANVDVIVARTVLPAHDAGLYAAGIILAKAVLFLPQFVVVLAFPDMAVDRTRRSALLWAIALITALGSASTVGAWLLPNIALVFVGGEAYSVLTGTLWAYALLGTVLSVVQVVVYGVVATQHRRMTFAIWLALAAIIVGATQVSSPLGLVGVVLTVDATLCAVLLLLGSVRRDPTRRSSSVGGGAPVGAEADGDVERDGEVGGAGHLLTDQ